MSGPPGPPTPAEMEYMLAKLVDRGFTFAEIARLTDRQIVDVVFHPRDEKSGEVAEKAEPVQTEGVPDHEQDRRAIIMLGAAGIPINDLIGGWEKKYSRSWLEG